MRSFFRGQLSSSRAIIRDWRDCAIVIAALVSSQGCSIISDAPSRALPTRGVPPAESHPGNLPSDKPALPGPGSAALPAADLPPPAATKRAPAAARIPEPAPPTMTETGLASWYGPKFHGRLTASGEVFNQEQFTAAHPTLPWGSRVKVTNLDAGKSVDVRINDRGPFKRGRIIDVSRAAARALGMLRRGITTVRIEWIGDFEKTEELALQDK